MSSLQDSREKVTRRQAEIDFTISVAMGRQEGFRPFTIIGNTFGQDIADGEKTVWDQDTTLVRLTLDTEIFLSSSNASDTAVTALITIVNEAFEEQTNTIVLNGQNQITTGLSGIVVKVVNVIGVIEPLGDIYAAPSTALTGGKPSDTTKIQSKIIQGLNVTHNGFYIIPKGFSSIFMVTRGNTNSINKVASFKNIFTLPGSVSFQTVQYSANINGFEFRLTPPIATDAVLGGNVILGPEGTFVEVKALVDSNTTNVFSGSDLILARTDKLGIANL
jgi:hypothetical protein